jgi:hypothetical protein
MALSPLSRPSCIRSSQQPAVFSTNTPVVGALAELDSRPPATSPARALPQSARKGYTIEELANGASFQPVQMQTVPVQRLPAPKNKADQIYMGTLPGEDGATPQFTPATHIPQDYF